MRKNLFLHVVLILGLNSSCNLNSKLPNNTEQKKHNETKEIANNIQEKQKTLSKNSKKQEYDNLIVPINSEIPSLPHNNGDDILNNTLIENNQKKEIKKEDLIPYTNEEKEADQTIKHVGSIITKYGGFSKLSEDINNIKNRYVSIKSDFQDVREKIHNELTTLKKNYNNNKTKIKELAQLQNNLKIDLELENLINKIDIATQEIESAAVFFNKAQESLKESIITRLKNRNRVSYTALQLSRKSKIEAENVLKQLESHAPKKGEAIAKSKEIEELIKNAKTILN
ncbi:P12 family lipoprotein [Borreliella yangtzensis]|uniref:P12 family lipoprotein n=1 Tax=Borreliella yangtzensis TaxID=683292 RepID=UPI00264A0E84|nr:P12 family lipoprotein [Borreliella yangtzensis]WKC75627.1 P12 family lipoprotein [Borreliella yangtzensis]